jgi:hypothetical protein
MKVKVWNDNSHPYTEIFKGDPVRIEAHSCIEMEEDEAIQFRGTYCAPIKGGDDQYKPESFKMIRVEKEDGSLPMPTRALVFKCNACREEFQTEASLVLHSDHAHKAEAFVDPDAEAEIKRRGRPAKAG